jgi:hypothetical protein
MVMSFCYSMLRRLLELIVLRGRREVAALRRQVSRPRFRPADRALLATLGRLLPRQRWANLIVCPATVRAGIATRWHAAGPTRDVAQIAHPSRPGWVWQQYGRALITAMREVDERHREVLPEAADFWLRLDLVIGLERVDEAKQTASSFGRRFQPPRRTLG